MVPITLILLALLWGQPIDVGSALPEEAQIERTECGSGVDDPSGPWP